MSNPLKNKTFSTVIKVAAIGLMAYGIGSAVMAASAAGTSAGAGSMAAAQATAANSAAATAGATGAATSGGVAAGIDAGVSAGLGATATGAATGATTGLAAGAGAAGGGGFLSGMMSNPMVQYGLVQTGGAMLQGAMTPEPKEQTNEYNIKGYASTNGYESGANTRTKPNGSTMPVYNRDTKRWES